VALFPFAQATAIMVQGARRRAQDTLKNRAQGAEQGRKALEPRTKGARQAAGRQSGPLITPK